MKNRDLTPATVRKAEAVKTRKRHAKSHSNPSDVQQRVTRRKSSGKRLSRKRTLSYESDLSDHEEKRVRTLADSNDGDAANLPVIAPLEDSSRQLEPTDKSDEAEQLGDNLHETYSQQADFIADLQTTIAEYREKHNQDVQTIKDYKDENASLRQILIERDQKIPQLNIEIQGVSKSNSEEQYSVSVSTARHPRKPPVTTPPSDQPEEGKDRNAGIDNALDTGTLASETSDASSPSENPTTARGTREDTQGTASHTTSVGTGAQIAMRRPTQAEPPAPTTTTLITGPLAPALAAQVIQAAKKDRAQRANKNARSPCFLFPRRH